MALLSFPACGCDSGSNFNGCDGNSGDSYVTTTFQAEKASIVYGTVESDHSGYTGSGYVNTDNAAGNYIEFSLTATQTATYDLTFYYALESGNRYGSIQVNGSTALSNIDFNATGSWTTWNVSLATVTLNSGANTIRVTAEQSGGLPNMDKMDVYGIAVTQGGSTTTDPGTDPDTDKTFIITAVNDNLDNNDMYVFAKGLTNLGYTKELEDTNVYSSELITYLGKTITTLYHTGHGYNGIVATYDGSIASNNVTLRAQNTIFASCLTMTDTAWKNAFDSTAQTLLGYTNYSYDYTDDTVAENMIYQLGNNATYKLAWYLSNAGIRGLNDRWAEYVREGNSIVEYSARTANTPKSTASQSILLGVKGRVRAVANLARSVRKFRSSFGIYAIAEKATVRTTTTTKSEDFDLTSPVTICEQEAIALAEDWLVDNDGLPDDAVLDQVIPIQRQSDDNAEIKIVGYTVHFQRDLQGTRVCGNRLEDHISVLVAQNSVIAVSKYWPVLRTRLSASYEGLNNLLSVGTAIQTAADEIANAVKQDAPIELIDAQPVFGTLGPRGGRHRLIPAFRVKSAEGHLFVINALTGRLLL